MYMEIDYRHTLQFADGWDPAALRGLLADARRIVLVAHTNADGDAVGSLTAMYSLLRRVTESSCHSATQPLSHSVTITPLLPDGCPDDLAWLPHTDLILSGKADADRCRKAIDEADLLVAMDLNNLDRTGVLAEAFKACRAKRLLFDHHIGPDRERFDLVVSDPEISSTCELIYWAFRIAYGHEVFDADAATSLFTGLCTDTGTFSYSNRQASLYLAAAELSQMGIDPMAINQQIKNVFTERRLKFFGHAMSELLTVYPEQGTALMVIRREDMEAYGVESAELTGLINEVMKLRDVECSILVREEDDKVRLSLRSKHSTDVNRLAGELFDGGGHTRAAGATSHLSLAETVKKVKQRLSLLPTLLLLVLNITLFASCGDVPVVDLQQDKGDTLKEHMINSNRINASRQETTIEAYISRRGWEMTSLGSGVRVMETEHGHGPQVNYEDTVTLYYSVEALEGTVIYDSVETTVVAGRMEPVPGLDAAVRTLREGSRAKVILPSEQAYGVPGDGNRIGHSMELLFDVKILKVRKLK